MSSSSNNEEWGDYFTRQRSTLSPFNSGNGTDLYNLSKGGVSAASLRRKSWACPGPGEESSIHRSDSVQRSDSGRWGDSPSWRSMASPGSSVGASPDVMRGGYWVDYKVAASPASSTFGDSVPQSPAGGHHDWEETHRQLARKPPPSLGTRTSRLSNEFYEYDELEAARMRIKQAAWEVIDAQQKVNGAPVPPLLEDPATKKRGLLSKLFSTSSFWKSPEKGR